MITVSRRFFVMSGVGLVMIGGLMGMLFAITSHLVDAHDIPAGLRADLESIAEDKGITFEEALELYGWQEDLGVVIAGLMDDYPNDFSDARVTAPGQVDIFFSSAIPAGAQEKISTFSSTHINVTVNARVNRGYSVMKTIALTEAVHFHLQDQPNVETAVTGFNPTTRNIESTVVLKGESTPASLNNLGRVVLDKVDEVMGVGSGIGVEFWEAEGEIISPDAGTTVHQGGEKLSHNYKYICTSGFGTINDDGTRGISTAGHCYDTPRDDGDRLTHGGDSDTSYGDFQWNTGPDTETNDFFAGSDDDTEEDSREAISVAYPFEGAEYCYNGAVSNKRCGEVIRVNICGGGICKLAIMKKDKSVDGDSGGPVYVNTAAIGLHYGDGDYQGEKRDLFSIGWFMRDAFRNDEGTEIATD